MDKASKKSARDAAIVIGGRAVALKATVEEYTELLHMLGIIGGNQEDNNYEPKEVHDYQSSYRHYRSIGIA